MADRYELTECGLLSGEEGVLGREHGESVEPGSEAENRTMVRKPGWLGPLGRSFSAVRATYRQRTGGPETSELAGKS
jgi:hypothetical protein